jgi:murein DD-endopeptidase MepM/ murein hydrolase activator NlpD
MAGRTHQKGSIIMIPVKINQILKIPIIALFVLSSVNIGFVNAAGRIDWFVPINSDNRQSLEQVRLTPIGRFGLMRKARPKVPAHLHTGVDIKRPAENYVNEPIFPAAGGRVISFRDDGPYAQIIIEHPMSHSKSIWTVYEHVAGINVKLGQNVDAETQIARFMNKNELNKHGWQFDHVHFEVMRVKPIPLKPDHKKPYRYYGTYCLICYNPLQLKTRYYNPFRFFSLRWRQKYESAQFED